MTIVNGSTTAGTCGGSGQTGSFVLANGGGGDSQSSGHAHDGGGSPVTVNVSATTTFADQADSAPGFQDVCVGSHVHASGTFASDGSLSASNVDVQVDNGAEVSGTVTTVNGSTTAGTCGSSGQAGSFVVSGGDEGGDSQASGPSGAHDGGGSPVTVNVSATTTFEDQADPAPGFQDVCVGADVHASGTTAADGSLTATNVEVRVETTDVGGTVTTVNGSTTSGTCGTSGGTGSFVVAGGDNQGGDGATDGGGSPVTVNVTSSTTFQDEADSSPGFQDVCVGSDVHATGTVASDGSLTATNVEVHAQMAEVGGAVTSVDGSTAAGSCGSAGGTGSFVVSGGDSQSGGGAFDGGGSPVTVNVTSSTTFQDQADSSPGFQDVCVGSHVNAAGTVAPDGSLTANNVDVHVEMAEIGGTVTAVDGNTTSGSCGPAGGTGSFVVSGGDSQSGGGAFDGGGSPVTVNVTSSTSFEDQADSSPGFQDVCVGSHVRASGMVAADGSLTANNVSVESGDSGGGGGGGGGGGSLSRHSTGGRFLATTTRLA